MPVEIHELVIKARVTEPSPPSGQTSTDTTTHQDREQLEPVEKAVKEILDILKRKNER